MSTTDHAVDVLAEVGGDLRHRRYGSRILDGLPKVVVGISVIVLVVIIVCAVFAPLIATHNPNAPDLLNPYAGPSGGHPFGQDSAGRDIFSRLVYGARLSLLGPTIVIAIAFLVGVPLGFLAAYAGGWLDLVVSRVFDLVFAFPALLLAIVIVATFGTNFYSAVFAVTITYVPLMGRVVRAAGLVERQKPYVEACRLQGYGSFRILCLHVAPNIGRLLVSQTTLYFAYALLDLSALSFLGLGAQPPEIDWGSMLENANQGVFQSATGVIFPAVAIILLVVSLNFVADWVLEYNRAREEDR
jgi:peptide/nickel transport system permease protein